MAHVAPIYPSFARGEVSPLMLGRIDIEQYPSCLEKCRNAYIRPYGCIARLAGTEYVSSAKNNGKARLLKFVFSATDSYIIECGAGYFRFYQDGAPVIKTNIDAWATATEYKKGDYVKEDGVAYFCVYAHSSTIFENDLESGYWREQEVYEILNDYEEEQLSSIQYVQIDDIIKLTCLPVNDDNTTAHPKELIRHGADDWEFKEVEFKETPYLDQNTEDTTITASATTGDNITLTASEDLFNAQMVGANFWLGTTVEDPDTNEKIQGYVKITEYTDEKHVKAKVESKLSGTSATKLWGEGAFSDYRGYPSVVALYDGRLYYARTPHQPRNIYGSKPYAYETFTPAVDNEDDAGINVELATNANGDGSDIKWMIGASYLLCGTYGGEFVIRGTGDSAITPTDISARQRTNWGGEPIQPIVAGSFVHFLQRNGNKLRQFQYDYYYDAYKAVDVSIFSEHLLESPIKEMALQKNPDSIIYLQREDGKVVMLTLEQDQSVQAWSLLEDLGGEVESIQTIPSFDGNYDEVYMLMKRQGLQTTLTYEVSNPELDITDFYVGTKAEAGVEVETLTYEQNATTFVTDVNQGSQSASTTNYVDTKGVAVEDGIGSNLKIIDGKLYKDNNLLNDDTDWQAVSGICDTYSAGYAIKNNALCIIYNDGSYWEISDWADWTYITGGFENDYPTATVGFGIADSKLFALTENPLQIDSEEGWTQVTGYIRTSGSSTTEYGYGIREGKLYKIGHSTTATQIGSNADWDFVTGYGSSLISAYALRGGRLYRISNTTATQVGSSTEWTKVSGYSGNSYYALGINAGKLYAISGTTATLIDQNEDWTDVSGVVKASENTGMAVRNNQVYIVKDINDISAVSGATSTTGKIKIFGGGNRDGARGFAVVENEGVWKNNQNAQVTLSQYSLILNSGEPKGNDTITLTYDTTEQGYQRYIERMKNPITPNNINDWWYVRSGLKYDGYAITKGINIILGDTEGANVSVSASDDIFEPYMVGNRIRFIDKDYNILGEGEIISYINNAEVYINITTPFAQTHILGGEWGISTDSISGLDHLNGQTVQIFADGIAQAEKEVQQGFIEIDDAFVALAGLKYQSYITTMPMEAGAQNGTAVGKRKRISEMAIRVWNSIGIKTGRDLDNLYEAIYGQQEPFTGVIPNIKYNQGWTWDANITVEQSNPYPMNILQIAPLVTEHDK